MKHLLIGAVLTILPAAGLAAPKGPTMMTMNPDPSTTPVPTNPSDAVVVAFVGGYGPKPEPATIVWKRYDPASGGIHFFPTKGETGVSAFKIRFEPAPGQDRGNGFTTYVGILPAGDYALVADLRGMLRMTIFCEGAPVMHIAPGSVTYLGSYRVYSDVKIEGSKQSHALGWEGDLNKAKEMLFKLPDLASKMTAADIHNGATFACITRKSQDTAYIIPGMPNIANATPPPSEVSRVEHK